LLSPNRRFQIRLAPPAFATTLRPDEHSSRHTMQVDHVLYARDLRKEWNRGRKRARA